MSRGTAKKVTPANGQVANVAPSQTHRPDAKPEEIVSPLCRV